MHTGERESDQGDRVADSAGGIERGSLMDERGYVAEALLDRLRDEGVPFRALGPEAAAPDLALAVAQDALPGMPRRMARFAQDFDLRLVQLSRDERPVLRSEELLSGRPEVLLLYSLVEAIQAQGIDEARAAWLSRLWHADPRGALERIGALWPARRDMRLLAHAAKQASWDQVRAALPRLRRILYRALPNPFALLAKLNLVLQPRHAVVAFVGFDNSALRERVVRDLAPAFPSGVDALELTYAERPRGADVAVLFDPPDTYRPRLESIVVERAEALPPAAAKVERALLRWLERRVERRFSDTVVGANPLAARILQFACRHRIPLLSDFM